MQPQPIFPDHASSAVHRDAERYREDFLHAEPFQHVVIDDFFEASFADQLLADFPIFDPRLALNEHGRVGGKSLNPNIREIGPVYRELYETISAPPFLELVSRLSGIPGLILDPQMYGGGTHENRHGQELDPHVDFNYDQAMQLHRRLNLIVYLNRDWDPAWGGALEIHSNPWKRAENQVKSYDPRFNRCVMFETNERSWHGFPRIELPPSKRHLSRKSISIYLYTKDRPAQEIAPPHGTFYVQRFLPDRIAAGYTLTAEDAGLVTDLLIRRDGWIQSYQRMELDKNRELADKNLDLSIKRRDIAELNRELAEKREELAAARRELAQKNVELAEKKEEVADKDEALTNQRFLVVQLEGRMRARLTGHIIQADEFKGLYADDWIACHAETSIQPVAPVSELTIYGFRPSGAPEGRLRVAINGSLVTEQPLSAGALTVVARPAAPLADTFRLSIDVEVPNYRFGTDPRQNLGFVLREIRARHSLRHTLALWRGR